MGVLVHGPAGSSYEKSTLPATHPSTPYEWLQFQIEQDFSLRTHLNPRELAEAVNAAIQEANPELEGLPQDHPKRLTRDLIQVTRCLGIDPLIFTALIWRESNFKPQAVSERGAVGLTQMTMPGIREVLERTHDRGYRRLRYARALFRKCAPSVFRNLPAQLTPATIARTKSIIAMSTLDGMVFGAFLLKLNLAGIRGSIHRWDIYRAALERYNGDPKVKALFAQDILALTRKMLKRPEVALNDSEFRRPN
jgi:hypothetical protein